MRLIDADALLIDLEFADYSALDIKNLITNAPTIQCEKWISVEDRLPEQFISVLAYFPECPAGIHQAVIGINADGFGDVALTEVGGRGYGTDYLQLVNGVKK